MNKEPFHQLPSDTWDMLARYLAGESDAEESARVRSWLAADPSRAELLKSLGSFLNTLPTPAAAEVDVEAALQRVKARRLEERTGTPWRRNLLRAAAVVAVVLGGSLIWRSAELRRTTRLAGAHMFATMPGRTDSVTLVDGTHVLLGPGSRLTVAAGYGSRSRVVELTGEALFDVVHDARRPFSVRAGGATIRDVGTTFAVRSNPGEAVHVMVTAGAVVLHAAAQQESQGLVLRAGQHGTLNPDGRAVAQTDAGTDADLAFTRGQLVLDNASLDHVAAELRRWYGIELRAGDSALTKRHVTASFQGETADQALHVIALTLGARIERNGDTAIVHVR